MTVYHPAQTDGPVLVPHGKAEVPFTVASGPDAVPEKLKDTVPEPPTTVALSSALGQLNHNFQIIHLIVSR